MSVKLLVAILTLSSNAFAGNVEVMLVDRLDGNLNSYCLDMKGPKIKADISQPLQAHTCYSYEGEIAVDQGVDLTSLSDNRLYFKNFDVCASLSSLKSGASVDLNGCNDNDLQKIVLTKEGKLSPVMATEMCFTAGQETRLGRGGTSPHQIKSLSLEKCSEELGPFQTWKTRRSDEISNKPKIPSVKFVVVDTRQEKCFDNAGEIIICPVKGNALYGQDAQYNGVHPSYTDNENQTVTDNVTGMMWQKTPDYKHYDHDDALNYCADLSVGDYHDWRLPTIKELYSLADFRGEIVNPRNESENTPYIDTDYFDFQYDKRMAYIGQYWSNTKYTLGSLHNTENVDAAFGFNFADGHIKAYETGYVFGTDNKVIKTPGNMVRCVRAQEGVYGVNKFSKDKNGTTTDHATGLMWQTSDDGIRKNWQDAMAYAESSTLAGYSDWRLPNIKELHSIVKYGGPVGGWPAIDTNYFTLSGDNTISDPMWVWSSTTQGDFKYTGAYISFGKAFSKKNSSATEYFDWHGAGAQRSDPKSGVPSDYDMSSENATDLVMTKNYVLLVRSIK